MSIDAIWESIRWLSLQAYYNGGHHNNYVGVFTVTLIACFPLAIIAYLFAPITINSLRKMFFILTNKFYIPEAHDLNPTSGSNLKILANFDCDAIF